VAGRQTNQAVNNTILMKRERVLTNRQDAFFTVEYPDLSYPEL
jgi:hypothetical protein